MKTKISPNAELDVLDRNELKTVLEEFASGYLRSPQRIRFPAAGTTDGQGAATIELYKVDPGYLFLLTRLEVLPEGYTFGAPFTSTNGYHDIQIDGDRHDGYGYQNGGSLPTIYTESESRAILARDGEVLSLKMVGGPVSKAVLVNGQGFLIPLPPA